uniref:Ig-like domain-containing protein n=1 Tax=Vombatus ursinus TaxID=29139 RepID=A0A4X2JZT0_VOMUR
MRRPWAPQPGTATSSVLLWVALLCLAPAIRSDGRPRAVLTLEPPWFNVLQGDKVTLNCKVFQTPGHHSIKWLHNGSALPIHQNSYTIPAVNMENSGEYQCRTEHTPLSNSVKLQVSSDPRPSTSSSFKFRYYVPFYIVMGLLFAVDTGLYFTLKREVNSSKKNTKCPVSG